MEKDIGKIPKNPETDIIVRVDDFGGRVGLTIREFVRSERYTGFTKAGTRIPAEKFSEFKEMINSISEKELEEATSVAKASSDSQNSSASQQTQKSPQTKITSKESESQKPKKSVPKKDVEEVEF